MIYSFFFRHVVRHIDAERAHGIAIALIRNIAHHRALASLIGKALRPRDPRLAVTALGRTFPSPLGVAAGMDKDATAFNQLATLGFGFVEVGTATASPQRGNARPRVHRLLRSRAVLNSMGFPNGGAVAMADRLRKRRETLVGVNVGKSMDIAIKDADSDYVRSITVLGPLADYLVLNVSSPNTPGLRTMQDVDRLEGLLDHVRDALRDAECQAPVLLKISPDLTNEEIDAIADVAVARRLDGIVAVNTTLSRDGVEEEVVFGQVGGVSGAPLKARAVEVLERLYDRVGERLVLVSVGGIETSQDAWERILAGATLVQAHTGFVFGGPLWAHRINRGLIERLEGFGAESLEDVRGSARRRSASTDTAESVDPSPESPRAHNRVSEPIFAGRTGRPA